MEDVRKSYQSPQLIDYGKVEDLTAAAAPQKVADKTIPAGSPLSSPS